MLRETPPHAIVIGLDSITGLQTARILTGHKIPVIAIATDPAHFACRTKVCEKILYVNTGDLALIRALENLGPQLDTKAVLFPCTDASVLLLAQHGRQLEAWFHLILPEQEVVEMLIDKLSFYKYARQAGLPVPGTFLLHSRQEAEEVAAAITFPCILKPSYKSSTWLQHSQTKAFKVSNAEAFLSLYDRCSKWTEVLMAQEWIEGSDADLYCCNCYFDKAGNPAVTFITHKLRQWPPETGTSCLSEEVRNDTVLQITLQLFQGVNYRGLGYVEMKCDRRTGKYYIIEPNIGRPTGRSASAEAGGVELLYTMYCDAVGWPLPENRTQKYKGVKWIYLRRDIQSALYYWRRGELSLKSWWQSWQGPKVDATFSWTDPAPFVADWLGKLGILLGFKKQRLEAVQRQSALLVQSSSLSKNK